MTSRFLDNGDLLLMEYGDAFVRVELVKVYDAHVPLRYEVRTTDENGAEVEKFGLTTPDMLQALGCFKGHVQPYVEF